MPVVVARCGLRCRLCAGQTLRAVRALLQVDGTSRAPSSSRALKILGALGDTPERHAEGTPSAGRSAFGSSSEQKENDVCIYISITHNTPRDRVSPRDYV